MKKFILTLFFCLIASYSFSADTNYYVKQSATGTEDGKSEANAWGVSDFNSSANWDSSDNADKIDPGDTVYLIGTITTKLEPQGDGTSSNWITIDGYEAGDCDQMSGTADANGAIINTSTGNAILLDDNHYLKFQDFTVTDIDTSAIFAFTTSADNVITNITFSRLAITESLNGIRMSATNSNHSWGGGRYVIIEDCLIKNIADGDTSSSKGGIRLFAVDDLIIRRNYIYNDSGVPIVVNGQDGIVVITCDRVLIEYNRIIRQSENCIDNKDDIDIAYGPIIIRFNVFGDTGENAVSLSDINGHHAYVYGNLFDGTAGDGIVTNALYIFTGYEYVWAWSNVVYDADKGGLSMYNQDSERPVDYGWFINNTVVHNRILSTSIEHGGIEIRDRTDGTYTVKNNIMVDNAINDSDYDQLYTGASAGDYTTANYNLYWTTANAPKVNWNHSSVYTLTDPVSGTTFYSTEGQGYNSRVADPLFVDYAPAGNRDLRLSTGSPAINSGENLSECFGITIQGDVYTICIDDALDPSNTDWTTTPPTVATVKRGTYGWSIGAYAYVGADETAPTISGASPSGEQTCTSDPRNVVISLNTNENATCRYSTNVAHAWADMAEMDSTGGTTHTQTESLACDDSYTYYALCQDTATNESDKETITFSIESGVPPDPPAGITGTITGGSSSGGSM